MKTRRYGPESNILILVGSYIVPLSWNWIIEPGGYIKKTVIELEGFCPRFCFPPLVLSRNYSLCPYQTYI